MVGQRFTFGPFVLSPEAGTLLRHGEPVPIGYRAFLLLTALLSRPGEVLTKSVLIDAAWQGAAVEETNLSVQMASLRKHLGPLPDGAEWITTIPRVGYRFVGSVESNAAIARRNAVASSKMEAGNGPSLAVLPFVNLSDDREQEYFADGMVEDIIAGLSRLRWLSVIARNSTFTYKGNSPDVRQVAADLGVRYVLEGSVRKAGDRLRVSSQLIDANTGTHVWADR
jgi:TolB-like protein